MHNIDDPKVNGMHYVIVISDNEEDTSYLTDAFQSQLPDLALRSFSTAGDTMQYLSALSFNDLPDLLIIDHPPDEDALSLIVGLKKIPVLRRIPSVVVAGLFPLDTIRSLYRNEANCFISKPEDSEGWYHMAHCLQTLFLSS